MPFGGIELKSRRDVRDFRSLDGTDGPAVPAYSPVGELPRKSVCYQHVSHTSILENRMFAASRSLLLLAGALFVVPGASGNLYSLAARDRPEFLPEPASQPKAPAVEKPVFIDCGFENASPVWYEQGEGGVIDVHLLYDHERSGGNRAAGHIHFAVEAGMGSQITLELKNLNNIYNGKPGSVAGELKALVTSTDGKEWSPVETRSLPGDRIQLDLRMTGPRMYVARVEPYRLSDLDRWLSTVKKNPLAEVSTIGKTVDGRDLEIVRIGNPEAPHHVFVRARAHAWEAGGNWVAQGLADRLLKDDDEAKSFRNRYCLWLMPMANKDGVAKGRTRFNLNGIDLNRGWDKMADEKLAPENFALENWLNKQIKAGRKPELALELHNDGHGLLHHARPAVLGDKQCSERLDRLEALLRKHTWFTEGSWKPNAATFTLADGFLQRYGVDAAVHELNCQWIAGLKERPTSKQWQAYGRGLARVLFEYFGPAER